MKSKKLLLLVASSVLLFASCGGQNNASSDPTPKDDSRSATNPFDGGTDEKKNGEIAEQLSGYLMPVIDSLKTGKSLTAKLEVLENASANLVNKRTVEDGTVRTDKLDLSVKSLSLNALAAIGGIDLSNLSSLDLQKLVAMFQVSAGGQFKLNTSSDAKEGEEAVIPSMNYDYNLDGVYANAYLSNAKMYADLSSQQLRKLIKENLPTEELKTSFDKTQSKFYLPVPDGFDVTVVTESEAFQQVSSVLSLLKFIDKDSLKTMLAGLLTSINDTGEGASALPVKEYIDKLGIKFYTYDEKSEKAFSAEVSIKSFADFEKIYNVFAPKQEGQEAKSLTETLKEEGVVISSCAATVRLSILKSGAIDLVFGYDVGASLNHKEEKDETSGKISSNGTLKLSLKASQTDLQLPAELANYEAMNKDTQDFIMQLVVGPVSLPDGGVAIGDDEE